MVSKEERNEKNRNKYRSKKMAQNKKLKLQQVCMNFYIPTTAEQMGRKVKLINIDIIDGKPVVRD